MIKRSKRLTYLAGIIWLYLLLGAGLVKTTSAQNLNPDTTMKQKMLGLRTCGYMVPDLQAAKNWYSKAFETKPYFDEPFYVGFTIGGYELGLMPEDSASRKVGDNVLVYWGVEDIQTVYESLIELGAKEHEAPHNVGGELMVASVEDPWGNVIGIIYNPYFKIE